MGLWVRYDANFIEGAVVRELAHCQQEIPEAVMDSGYCLPGLGHNESLCSSIQLIRTFENISHPHSHTLEILVQPWVEPGFVRSPKTASIRYII